MFVLRQNLVVFECLIVQYDRSNGSNPYHCIKNHVSFCLSSGSLLSLSLSIYIVYIYIYILFLYHAYDSGDKHFGRTYILHTWMILVIIKPIITTTILLY